MIFKINEIDLRGSVAVGDLYINQNTVQEKRALDNSFRGDIPVNAKFNISVSLDIHNDLMLNQLLDIIEYGNIFTLTFSYRGQTYVKEFVAINQIPVTFKSVGFNNSYILPLNLSEV